MIANKSKAENNIDTYLQGRAIQIAQFEDDEIVPTPQFHYILPGERIVSDLSNTSKVRTVKIFDPQLSITGLVVKFNAPVYQIADGRKKYEISSFKGRVEDILSDGSIELANEDIVSPSRGDREPLGNNLIKITRVSIAQIDEFSSLPYQTKKIDDPTLDKGKTKIQTPGRNGKKQLSYSIRREDGVEISRVLVKTSVIDQPIDEVIKIGTKPVITGWCKYNDDVIAASIKNNLDPDKLCALMKKESNGHPDSVNPDGPYIGLFQYTEGFWADATKKAGFAGANIYDAKSQIYVTAWALTHGYAGRW
jgi:hypothetical protein